MSKLPEYFFALREDLLENPEFLPTKGEGNATGWDVRCAAKDKLPVVIRPFEYVKIPLGFRSLCPVGWWYELRTRSSIFAKKNIHSLYGVIDQDYSNELVFACQFIPDRHYLGADVIINFGDAIGQLVPVKRQEMIVKPVSNDDFDKLVTDRNPDRKGGFGSTGK
jgi:dUTPase